jgi:hypothetical protein
MLKLRWLCLGVLSAIGCATDPSPTPTNEVSQAICTPRPPIDPRMCNPEEPVAPPPINGKCTIELRVTKVGFWTGQGWVEDRAEANAFFTATNQDTGTTINGEYPGPGQTIKMEVDSEHNVSILLGTYEVSENDPNGLTVNVCGTFTEKDGGLNKDDVGSDCTPVHLECPQAEDDVPLEANLCKGGNCSKLKGAMSANINVSAADADRDCVPNEQDWTPQPCDEAFKGQLCRASLVYFHYGDGFINDVVQNVGTDLVPALTGYDHTVLLIDDTQIGPFKLNAAALDAAEVVMLPTEQNFFAAMRDLTSQGCDIDVWTFSHGWPDWDTQADGTEAVGGGKITAYADDDGSTDPDITTDELLAATNPAVSGTPKVPVRMTYATACNYKEWNGPWQQVGAKVVSGSTDINFTPNFYDNFVASWNANQTYGTALATERTVGKENLAFGFIAAVPGAAWGCTAVGDTVLDKGPCAFDFFTDVDKQPMRDANGDFIDGADDAHYAIGGPLADRAGITYDATTTGAVNMRRSSVKILGGTAAVRKGTVGLTWP